MDIKENIRTGAAFVADTATEIAQILAEKNRLRIQLNSIRQHIKSENATRDQAYEELGRFFYENLRETASPENEALCAVIDASSERISKASIKYLELLNLQNETKVRSENAEKLKKVMAEKAKEAAEKAKEQGAELSKKAKEFAVDTAEKAKEKAAETAEQVKGFAKDTAQKAKEAATGAKDIAEDAMEDIVDKVEDVKDQLVGDPEIDDLIREEQEKMTEEPDDAEEAEAPAEPEKEEESPDNFEF